MLIQAAEYHRHNYHGQFVFLVAHRHFLKLLSVPPLPLASPFWRPLCREDRARHQPSGAAIGATGSIGPHRDGFDVREKVLSSAGWPL
jgi:hypothetical protein